ncbi:hypothetical protein FRC09_020010 [Ceratobasidium sp. 395]|nr:hypothetical protein FRC09_020010 [Ceratobasidium sp. 395]
MVGRAKSLQKRRIQYSEEKEQLTQEAVSRYQAGAMRTIGGKKHRKGLRTICTEVSNEHATATGRRIKLSHETISRRSKGGRSQKEAREAQAHLTKAEAALICSAAIETAKRGFPFSHKRLEEHINQVIRKRLPSFRGVGLCFTQRFVDAHHDKLSTYSSRSLEGVRGNAVNPTTVEAWFEVLGDAIEDFEIEEDTTYGADETGVQGSSGNSERVIGPQGSKIVYQIRTGSRETITVIVTICADGTSLPPTVIFKGKHYLVKWDQDNPLNASIAHSQKGWVNGEIALAWLRDFDEKTREKAAGRYRLLIVDGHTSHVGLELLDYARDNKIVMLCYPSHTTHVLQGLDKVCFGPFKERWSKERDQYERKTGQPVEKSTFMGVLAKAYKRAFTKRNIQAAFRATGVYPFNPSAIPAEDLAPALERSRKAAAPLPQPAPVQVLVEFLRGNDSDSDSEVSDSGLNLRQELSKTSVGYLFSDSPVDAETAELPEFSYRPLDPISSDILTLADMRVASPLEASLQAALQVLIERDRAREDTQRAMTAQLTLQGLYSSRLREQLAEKEKKRNRKRGKLLGDGMPALLTSDEYHQRVADQARRKRQEEDRKKAAAEARERYKEAVKTWKEDDEKRAKRNQERAEEWKEEVNAWEIERDVAKAEKRKPRWRKPVKPKAEKAAPKPTLTLPSNEVDASDGENNSSDEDEVDEL